MSKKAVDIISDGRKRQRKVFAIGPAMEILYRGGLVPTVFSTCGVGEATQSFWSNAKTHYSSSKLEAMALLAKLLLVLRS